MIFISLTSFSKIEIPILYRCHYTQHNTQGNGFEEFYTIYRFSIISMVSAKHAGRLRCMPIGMRTDPWSVCSALTYLLFFGYKIFLIPNSESFAILPFLYAASFRNYFQCYKSNSFGSHVHAVIVSSKITRNVNGDKIS